MTGRGSFRVEAIAKRLPARVGALLDYLSGERREHWGGPFNGQARRQEMVREILEVIDFDAVVETGTFRGMTTEFLRRESRLPIRTVEINRYSYHYARLRFRHDPGVKVELDDSRRFLSGLAEDETFPGRRVLFYLDAHWESELPLWEEIQIIARNWSNWLVIVDDFQVPGDPGYAFDEYESGGRLTLDHLPLDRLQKVELFWPAAHSSTETGNRRGCLLITPPGEIATKLGQMTAVRQIP